MAASYEICCSLNLKYVQISGKTNLKELRLLLEKYLADPDFDSGHRQLIDLREMEDAIAGFWEMLTFKKIYVKAYEKYQPIKVTIIAETPFSKRLCWMFSRVMKDKKTMDVTVLNSFPAALSHLNLAADALDQIIGPRH